MPLVEGREEPQRCGDRNRCDTGDDPVDVDRVSDYHHPELAAAASA